MTTSLRAISLLCSAAFAPIALGEIDPLKLGIRTTYPTEISTVGQGAQWLLEATEYRLVVQAPAPTDAQALAARPIPPMARIVRTMAIEDALIALVGTENYLVIDRKNMLVSFTANAE